MINKTDMAKSGDAQNQASLIAQTKSSNGVGKISSKLNLLLNQKNLAFYYQNLSLKTKAVILAIALGTLPILTVGAIAHNLLNKSITQQVTESQQTTATRLTDTVNRFMLGRYTDIQLISRLPFLANPQVSTKTTKEEKQAVLDSIIQIYQNYDSIAVFDIQGELIAQSTGEILYNQKGQSYFQETLQKDSPIIHKSDRANIYIAAPVKDTTTDQVIAVVRAKMPIQSLEAAIQNYADNGHIYNLLDTSGIIFLSPEKQLLGKEAKATYPDLESRLEGKQVDSFLTVPKINRQPVLLSYVPSQNLTGLPNLDWQILLTTDADVINRPQKQLLWTIILGTALSACTVGAIAAWLAKRTIKPLLNANAALEKLGQGEFSTRIEVDRKDELGALVANINQVAEHLQILVKQRTFVMTNVDQEWQPQNALQLQLLELLSNVEGVAKGDLTVRADVTAGEIGTVADFFNSIVENLRDIVTQVKQAAGQLNTAIGSNEGAIRQLAEEALTQAAEINRTLDAVDQMTHSMQAVADSAQQAATVANHAAFTATKSGQAMDLTVQNILSLRETVGETAKKVKRLGESSQQISRVVSIINQIATQTNLLAINAGIEAARAGEEGEGFGVVAEEIGELAARSAVATQEIEQIVENIQRETSEVVKAMEVGTTQVVEGTRIVEEAKQSLSQILDVSRQIDYLIQSISTATVSQVETSQTVNKLMQDIASVSQRSSDSSRLVAQSLKQTVEISHHLQKTVGTFKVS
ncbi:methyl-accepting chemotaxis protein [Anabaena subtropica]|uniref:HAMP domain-containing protein n=1 Tax=Anabaena subtropica FACHB-260 TaxID=2692884 RepID=A0ABR8CNX8_9NOST|nr:methyl-accepting chemotaxis protein [Anabaena subtropica]MBD2344754.1 HAMP domain-containing protein [Anabaena subtropica FACHB-260]